MACQELSLRTRRDRLRQAHSPVAILRVIDDSAHRYLLTQPWLWEVDGRNVLLYTRTSALSALFLEVKGL
jgi:hypothetical protein